MKYLYKEYLEPIEIDSFRIVKLKEATKTQLTELAKMYCTIFNADNKEVIKKLNITGKTLKEGLWNEEPYTKKLCEEILNDYKTENYIGVMALGKVKNKEVPLGALVIQIRDLQSLQKKGYAIPFDIPNNTKFWCGIDTFKRDITMDGKILRHLAIIMRNTLVDMYEGIDPILIYSSTNNPVMVKSWKNDMFTVIEKETTFGNKYQSLKLIA